MTIKLSKEEEYQYKDSKEFLERQQNIDALIALARVAEIFPPTSDNAERLRVKIITIIDKV